MVSFTRKSGTRVRLPSLTPSKRKAATQRATEKRRLKQRMTKFAALTPSKVYPLARGYYGITRSPRVVTQAGRPVKAGLAERERTQRRFMRALKRDPQMAATFLSGVYGR